MRSLRLYVSSRRAEPPDMAWETYPGADIELPREIPENIYFSGHSFIHLQFNGATMRLSYHTAIQMDNCLGDLTCPILNACLLWDCF